MKATNPGSLAWYREMYALGKHQVVKNLLLKGDGYLGKNGFTYNSAFDEFTSVSEITPILDNQGAWAGEHKTHVYKADGSFVGYSTYYSLFN